MKKRIISILSVFVFTVLSVSVYAQESTKSRDPLQGLNLRFIKDKHDWKLNKKEGEDYYLEDAKTGDVIMVRDISNTIKDSGEFSVINKMQRNLMISGDFVVDFPESVSAKYISGWSLEYLPKDKEEAETYKYNILYVLGNNEYRFLLVGTSRYDDKKTVKRFKKTIKLLDIL